MFRTPYWFVAFLLLLYLVSGGQAKQNVFQRGYNFGLVHSSSTALFPAEVGDSVPGEHAFHADDQVIPIRCNQFHQCIGPGLDILVDEDIPILVQDADLEFPHMQVDPAVIREYTSQA